MYMFKNIDSKDNKNQWLSKNQFEDNKNLFNFNNGQLWEVKTHISFRDRR